MYIHPRLVARAAGPACPHQAPVVPLRFVTIHMLDTTTAAHLRTQIQCLRHRVAAAPMYTTSLANVSTRRRPWQMSLVKDITNIQNIPSAYSSTSSSCHSSSYSCYSCYSSSFSSSHSSSYSSY
eukprot:GHVU01086116.1.p2 GENE.GHVU01086116.1~~GHVU01086116.1.p2  ORF type:complete len:124 (-),score=19.51 GHVU01086116.1:13-384(-)